jgi:hypothetical protein
MPPPQRPRSVQERAAAMQTPITANDGAQTLVNLNQNPNYKDTCGTLAILIHITHCKLSVKEIFFTAHRHAHTNFTSCAGALRMLHVLVS